MMVLVCENMWGTRRVCKRVGGCLRLGVLTSWQQLVEETLTNPPFKTSRLVVAQTCYPRIYTRAFGECLLSLWDEERTSGQPRLSMRQKVHVATGLSDRELFQGLQLGDTWPDAEMVQVWSYLYNNKQLLIPSSWQSIMHDFNIELLDTVPRPRHSLEQLA